MPEATNYFLTQGVLGAVAIILAGVIVKLYNETKRIEAEKADILNQRRLDDRETIRQTTAVLSENAQNMKELSGKIELSKQQNRGNA